MIKYIINKINDFINDNEDNISEALAYYYEHSQIERGY